MALMQNIIIVTSLNTQMTAIIGLISEDNEQDYLNEVSDVTEWCNKHNLLLNVNKTEKNIFDVRKKYYGHNQLSIAGSNVDIAHSYKYIDTIIDDKLSCSLNTDNIYNKYQQCLYFLRRLKSFGVDNIILKLFYMSIVQSVVSFNIIVWWASLGKGQPDTLNRINKKAIKLVGESLCKKSSYYNVRCCPSF